VRRAATWGAAVAAWLVLLVDAVGLLPGTRPLSVALLAFGVGMTSTVWLLLRAYHRPLAACYQLGYEDGKREAGARADGPDGGARVLTLVRRAG
jgi:hypothetical protein